MTRGATRCDVFAFYTLLIWLVMIMAANFQGGGTEVASSVSVMTSLVSQEEKLIEHLSKVLDLARTKRENTTWITRIKRYLDCIEVKHRAVARASGNLAHPIIGFRLVRRLAKDWNDVTGIMDLAQSRTDNAHALYDNLKGMREVISKWTRWPKIQDLKDTAMGLIRIGTTYQLYPATIHHEYGAHEHWTGTSQHGNKTPVHVGHRDDALMGMSLLSSLAGKDMFRRHGNNINGGCVSIQGSKTMECSPNFKDDSGGERSTSDTSNNNSNNDHDNNEMHHVEIISSKNVSNNNNNNNVSGGNEINGNRKKKQLCYYNYASLDFKDVLFIINVAIRQKLKVEAQDWYNLLESYTRNGQIDGVRKKMDDALKKIQAIKSDAGPIADPIMKKYGSLCREASQVDDISPGPVSRTLHCYWRYAYTYVRYKVELLHTSPDVYQFLDVISPHEINHIKDMAREKLVPSALDIDENTKRDVRYWRVSQTAWFRDETPVLQKLSERVGQLTGLDTGIVTDARGQLENVYSEPLQVVNYGLGGLYGPHLDTLHSTSHPSKVTRQHTGDRLATWMFYLGDVQVGGATVFPHINVSVKPIKGSAILWYNLLRNGQIDNRTVHAGCPVVIGDKWVANKWVRDTAQWKARPCLLDPLL